MRKAQKKQAEEFVKFLGEAHEEIRKDVERKEQALAMDLLKQCQKGAITLGNLIEQEEGEGLAIIRLLEDYCELVYQFHEKIGQGLPVNAGKECKLLQKSMIRIENSIRHDIKVRQEVVFLPYKASMWDSLESVWKAAEEDPNCDAYVVPIPYFDKAPDGSFLEMHYEGDLYPEYVPVTDYKNYDFARRRPDVIFIHNPYDDYNVATSVHPAFYTPKLKEYTEKLVYIPYFILAEIDPEDTATIKSMEHFFVTFGALNSDRTIVQSENMRQVYINALTEFAGEHTRKQWEERILGLGSPKVDKLLNTRRESLEMPEEWMRVILKPDGSWKKIILYNTSVTVLLTHGEKMLEKMKMVFEAFKANREEIALLWRPHPLIEATISSMQPQLWAAYEDMLKEYQSGGWGIYDDTTDLDRAIVLCDGYYGDASSLVQLCQMVGKPAMIQDI